MVAAYLSFVLSDVYRLCRRFEAFSRGVDVDGLPLTTIRATDELYQQTMGQRLRLSFYDAKYVNHIYCNRMSLSLHWAL